MDNSNRDQKRARRSVNDILQAFYDLWLHRFEEDSHRFFAQVIADRERLVSPSTAPAE
jgi:hypothetical protein